MRLAEKSPTIAPHRFLPDADTVIVLSESSVAGETGQRAEVYTIRDGKTVRVQVYADTAMMERQYGLNPCPPSYSGGDQTVTMSS